ncbi:hypothetical protein [Streptomyces sp. NBRC 110028]|uniref:hypothetical protein n=1 Tax=Streptomyces sp. NBRC 110028 TaxID=1621260 RepID=UPI0006E2E3D5|nr:hypothetical protein [Streptomyces sp. NBRC 110028]
MDDERAVTRVWRTSDFAETRIRPDEESDDDASVRDRLGSRKTTVLTAAAAALVLTGCLLAMSTIIDSASSSSGDRWPSGGKVSITAPPGQEDELAPSSAPEENPSADSTAAQPPLTNSPAGPSQGDGGDEREGDREDEDDEEDDDHEDEDR